MTRVKQAVFLVGGKGSRLGQFTVDTPKPLLEIGGGVRFLDLLIDEAARHGFTEIILLAGYHGDQVEALYHGRSIRGAMISVVRELVPAGTAGALLLIKDRLDPWFLMANGDSLFDINLRALARPLSSDGLARIALRHVEDVSRYGAVTLDGDRVTGFREKSSGGGAGLINGGVYMLNRDIIELVRSPSSMEQDVFPALVDRGALRGVACNGYFLDIGLPDTLEQARRELLARRPRPAVFFDRDGTLNVEIGYAHKPSDLRWINGARELIADLNERGYLVFVVTNQAGIAKGYYGEGEMQAFHEAMQTGLAELGGHIDGFYHCPYHDEAAIASYRVVNHTHRKPNPGMILQALAEWPVRTEVSVLVGDQDSDVEAARRAGIAGVRFTGGDLRATTEAAIAALAIAGSAGGVAGGAPAAGGKAKPC